ncbi:MAG: SDR family oxidoreductase [Candidatus Kapaibacteriales bacterium]
MKVMVTGASGIIAEAIIDVLQTNTNYDIIGISSKKITPDEQEDVIYFQVDTLDFKKLRKIIHTELPDVIINTVGLHDIELCNANKKLAWDLNVEYIKNLVSLTKILDSWLISFSTEFVFDGGTGRYTEKTVPNPANYLGKSKLAAENVIKTSEINFTIIRLPLVYGVSTNGKMDFVQNVIKNNQNGQKMFIPKGYYTNPILSDDIAWGILKLLDYPCYQILHFGGKTYLDLYEFAIEIERIFNFSSSVIVPETLAKPKKFGLDPLFSEMRLDVKFSSVREGLTTFKYLYDKEESPFEKLFG